MSRLGRFRVFWFLGGAEKWECQKMGVKMGFEQKIHAKCEKSLRAIPKM
jgi:hypothetical protein